MKLNANPLAPRSNRLMPKSSEIKGWIRQIIGLDDDTHISLSELACRDEGCPDIETVAGIFETDKPIRTIRIHLPIAEITLEDVQEADSR